MAKLLSSEYALELRDIHKSFFQNQVLKGISIAVPKGSILGLLGGNGAGKSTLMKIVNGIYRMDRGQILVNGEEVVIRSARDAARNGIAMVYQELSLVPTLSVVQNLFLHTEPHKGLSIDEKACLKKAKQAFEELGIDDIALNAPVGDLPIGKQQLVEIVKALLKNPHVLILDEPTASLAPREISMLFDFLRKLKARDIAIVLISHHMQEIKQLCDRTAILRNGIVALDHEIEGLTISDMVEAMVGRKIQEKRVERKEKADVNADPLLVVEDLSSEDQRLNGVSFELKPGEVVGIAGLMGSGRTELIKSIFGLRKIKGGRVLLKGRDITGQKPWKAIENGVFMIPEDRRKAGIIAGHSVKMNLFTSAWKRFARFTCIDDRKANEQARDLVSQLDIKTTSIFQEVKTLSGGNQQKVVFGKSLFLNPQVLLLDDPTVGVDVEAKDSICHIISSVADAGSAVLLISSEFDQMARVCDRVLIMRQGRIVDEKRDGADEISETSLLVAAQA